MTAGRPAPGVTLRRRRARAHGLLLLAPSIVTLGALTLYPTVWVLWLSLQRRIPIFDVNHFEGLGNYIFLAGDPRFWKAAEVTVLFTLASVALEVAGGVAAALALRGQRWGSRVALSFLLLAWALPSVVTAKLFEWLYNPAAGLVNFALGGIALNWLGDPRLALVATLTRITLPLIRRILLIAVLFRTLDALRSFDLMFVLTGGGPAGTTETLTVYAYRSLFQAVQLGLGSAVGVVVFALVMAVAWGYLRALRREGLTV